MTLAKMSVYFFIVGTGSGGPFVFASLGFWGQLAHQHDLLTLSFFISLVGCGPTARGPRPKGTEDFGTLKPTPL